MPLEPEQIGQVREIARLNSFEYAEKLVAGLNSTEETQLIAYIAEWQTVKRKFTIIKGGGVDIDKNRYRLAVINDVRRLLGLSEMESELCTGETIDFAYSHPATIYKDEICG